MFIDIRSRLDGVNSVDVKKSEINLCILIVKFLSAKLQQNSKCNWILFEGS